MAIYPEEVEQRPYVEYMRLDEAATYFHEDNPKDHNIGGVMESINEQSLFADLPTFDEAHKKWADGHGRIKTMIRMMDGKQEKPVDVMADVDGMWRIPVIRGLSFKSPEHLKAYLVAANQLTIDGGWDLPKLQAILTETAQVSEKLLNSTGFDLEELQTITEELNGKGDEGDDYYTKEVKSPLYEPKREKPDIEQLYDSSKVIDLMQEILTSSLSEDEQKFLIQAAARHTVFDYSKIADYYAHSNDEMKLLMEKSALVIIDYNQAIELGYVKLSQALDEQSAEEYG